MFFPSLRGYQRDRLGRWRRGAPSQTYSGGEFWVLDPRADEVTFDDVCVGLARECRYGNQSREWLSVAEHSLIVSLYAERSATEQGYTRPHAIYAAQLGLLHDGSEAYLHDMMRPLKRLHVFRGYRRAEARLQRVIFEHFGVRTYPHLVEIVEEVDRRVVADEVEACTMDPEFYRSRGEREPLGASIAAMPWEQAASAWTMRFAELFPEYVDDVARAA